MSRFACDVRRNKNLIHRSARFDKAKSKIEEYLRTNYDSVQQHFRITDFSSSEWMLTNVAFVHICEVRGSSDLFHVLSTCKIIVTIIRLIFGLFVLLQAFNRN
jgi:hypothetical protein